MARNFTRPAAATFLVVAGYIVASSVLAEASANVRFKHLGVDDGLSHTTVWDVEQDRRGFVWLTTETSVQRYDGYRLKSYAHDPEDPGSLSESRVSRIFEDRRGDLWFATRWRGVNRYDRAGDRFERFPLWSEAEHPGERHYIRDLADDAAGHLWIATYYGLVRLDPASGETLHFNHRDEDPTSLSNDYVYAVWVDSTGTVWAGTDAGLDRLDEASGTFTHYVPVPEGTSGSNEVTAIFEAADGELWIGTYGGQLYRFDRTGERLRPFLDVGPFLAQILGTGDGRLWISTYGNGLYRVTPATRTVENWRHDPGDRESLSSDRARRLELDRAGLLWVSTRNGVSIFDPRRSSFSVYRHRNDGAGPAGRNVTALAEDRRGRIWIGSQEGELTLWDPTAATFEAIDLLRPEGSGQGSVYALHESGSGELWIGGQGFFGRVDRERRRFQPSAELVGASVRAIAEDGGGDLWLGTFGNGLVRFDPSSSEIEELPADPDGDNALASDNVYAVLVDRSGRVWAGCEVGLSRIDPATGNIKTWRHDPARPDSLAFDNVVDLFEDRAGRIWLATYGGGLDRYDAQRDAFHHHRERDGLANNNTVGLLEDDEGGLWISTNQGLSRLAPDAAAGPEGSRFRTYTVDDGLSSNVFLIGARLETHQGRLIFGGHDGLTVFSPQELEDDSVEPPVVLTELRIGGDLVTPGAPGSPLEHALDTTRKLVLTHHQASFSLEFAAPHFANPRENRYAFRLDPYDDAWIPTDAVHRRARYTNLDAGNYVFRVKASNQDGMWSSEPATLELTIRPPPWESWWAYTIYALAILAGAFGFDRWHRRRLENERRINHQLREVDRLKNEFLANTSHELRTPLYGITGLAESLLEGVHGKLPDRTRSDLSMIVDSGRRLGALVNDILDYSRLRDRELGLDWKVVDLHGVVDTVLSLLRPLADDKQIELRNAVPVSLPPVRGDQNRLQQIFLNLAGNAVKFTDQGYVEITAQPLDDGKLRIEVADSGIGIEPEHLGRIFEPFEQADGDAARRFGGTGIGLAVTRHLVELHGGLLEVSSAPGEGSRFWFSLPLADAASVSGTAGADDEPAVERQALVPDLSAYAQGDEAPPLENLVHPDATILIVDDEPVVRQVLCNQLAPFGYRLLQAKSGPEALKLLDEGPDLVLLDIMMPHMPGFEVCRTIRQRFALEELPVIYLTARSQVEDLVRGFSTGANDYLTKPIDREELISRVTTHLELARLHSNLEEVVEQRTAQIKVLRGLLPVCASCKKIRDREGAWNDLEVYLDHHSEAQLTHGICDDCVRELYPEINLEAAR